MYVFGSILLGSKEFLRSTFRVFMGKNGGPVFSVFLGYLIIVAGFSFVGGGYYGDFSI